jgi:hypothetical protein
VIEKIGFPALGATGGMLLSQWVHAKVATRVLAGYDPKLVALGASALTAYGVYMVGDSLGLSPETQMTVAAGAGVAGLTPWVPAAMQQVLVAEAAPTIGAPSATSGYYNRGLLGGLMVDVSHAGAPYKGMLGLGSMPSDQREIDNVLTTAEAISTVEPMDPALPAIPKKAVRRVREKMGSPGDRGWAGGTFARSLFSGTMG